MTKFYEFFEGGDRDGEQRELTVAEVEKLKAEVSQMNEKRLMSLVESYKSAPFNMTEAEAKVAAGLESTVVDLATLDLDFSY